MGFTIEGSHALVTGASSGIGAAIAEASPSGARPCAVRRRADRLADVLARCRVHAPESRLWVVDLADLDATTRLAHEAEDAFGGVDLLVNNAGIPKRRMVEALTDAEVESLMRINYLSPVRLTMALLPGMRAVPAIVNLGWYASVPGGRPVAAGALTAFAEASPSTVDSPSR
jgi:NAD(P)-dependent dehydrogenase (short-subunit alcohol dehydrogenase family)